MTPQQLIGGKMPTVPVTHQGRNIALLLSRRRRGAPVDT